MAFENPILMPVGEQGEIIIHGPEVFDGYWKRPDATEAAFVDIDGKRFFRSGDLGHTDEDDYFWGLLVFSAISDGTKS